MFKVGEKRRPAKFVPGVAKIEVVRAVSTQPELDHDALPFGFVSLKWKAHDPARTKRRPMAKNASGKYEIVFSEEKEDSFSFEYDIPHINYEGDILVELFGTPYPDKEQERARRFRASSNASEEEDDAAPAPVQGKFVDMDREEEDVDPDDDKDILMGAFKLPVEWIVDGYGGGYGVTSEDPVIVRVSLQGARLRSFPFELELRIVYVPTPEASQRATLRWTTHNLQGEFELDRSRSDEDESVSRALKTPFVLRRLEEYGGEQKLVLRVGRAGQAVQFVRSTQFFKEDTGEMRVDEMFQSVRNYYGGIVERRLYWDFSSMGRIRKTEPYPAPILVCVSRIAASKPQIVDAWTLSKDFKLLTQLTMIGSEQERRYKKTFVRIPEEPQERVIHPKLTTRPGRLFAVVMYARDLVPEEKPDVSAFVGCRVLTFADDDLHYERPIDQAEQKEQMTPVMPGTANPVYNQIFEFQVRPEKDFHTILVLQVWNRESDEEEVLIGMVRVPVPWLFNGCGSDQGPLSFASYEGSFKLKRGDSLDPTQKLKYAGGRVRLRLSYVPN